MRGQGVHAKALRIRAFWSEIGRTPGETPSPGKSHTRDARRIKMPGTRAADQHQRRRRNVELLEIRNHVETRECRQQRPRRKFSQYLHLHLRLKDTYPRCEFTATAEEAMWRPKTEMIIYDPSNLDPAKTKVIGKVVRYTKILEAPIPKLLNEDGKLIDTGQIIITQKLQELENDIYVTMVGTLCHFQGQVHHYCEHRPGDSCNLLGIRVPKCTRWRPQRIHSETYCQVR